MHICADLHAARLCLGYITTLHLRGGRERVDIQAIETHSLLLLLLAAAGRNLLASSTAHQSQAGLSAHELKEGI